MFQIALAKLAHAEEQLLAAEDMAEALDLLKSQHAVAPMTKATEDATKLDVDEKSKESKKVVANESSSSSSQIQSNLVNEEEEEDKSLQKSNLTADNNNQAEKQKEEEEEGEEEEEEDPSILTTERLLHLAFVRFGSLPKDRIEAVRTGQRLASVNDMERANRTKYVREAHELVRFFCCYVVGIFAIKISIFCFFLSL